MTTDHIPTLGCACPACMSADSVFTADATPQEAGKPVYTLTEVTDNLTRNNMEWSGSTVTYGFTTVNPGYGDEASGYSTFSAAQKAAARDAMEQWNEVAGITFVESANGNTADIRFSNTTSGPQVAWAYYPATSYAEGGDVWINPNYWANSYLDYGDYGYLTMVHEIGHAIGLSHPGEYNGGSPSYSTSAEYEQDTRQYTVMSYFEASNTGADHSPPGYGTSYAATPLLHDIAAIQSIYGANMSTRTGNSVYGFNSNVANDSFDFTINTAPVVAIWDAGGIDTIDVSGTNYAQSIDLHEGAYSDILGMTGNLAIAFGVVIENAKGGSGADTITGNAANNYLVGNAGNDSLNGGDGNDVLDGGLGADTLNGGTGYDWADYRASSAGVTVDLSDGLPEAGGDAAGDILIGIERVIGSVYSDTLTGYYAEDVLRGYGGDDFLNGGDGNDFLDGGTGADTLNGGNGYDWAYYDTSSSGVTIDLSDGLPEAGGDAQGDVLISIERILGSSFADMIAGDGADNLLRGSGGDDTLIGNGGTDTLEGGAGADTLDGGGGKDWADYYNSASAVTIDMGDGLAEVGGDAQGDTLINIEWIRASNFADSITGDGGDNYLRGVGGNDTINGGDGNDVLDGGTGADTLNGGAGTDWADYRVSSSGVTIDLSDGLAEVGGDAQGDVLISIERVAGSYYGDTLTGTDDMNVLRGLGGNDVLNGLGGNDFLDGGAGADTLNGGAGADWAYYDTSSAGVTIDMSDGLAEQGGDAQGDVLNSIEHILGSNFDDSITGDAGNNNLRGGAGADMLDGGEGGDVLDGGAGADTLIGGGGIDWADYRTSSSGVTIDLGDGLAESGGDAEGDTLSGIERILGSNHDDTLVGDGGDNYLRGGGGNDTIEGAAGDDTLEGGLGDDTFYFHEDFGSDTVTDFGVGDDTLCFVGDFGETTAEDLMAAYGSQQGDHYVFDFGTVGHLTLLDTDESLVVNHIAFA